MFEPIGSSTWEVARRPRGSSRFGPSKVVLSSDAQALECCGFPEQTESPGHRVLVTMQQRARGRTRLVATAISPLGQPGPARVVRSGEAGAEWDAATNDAGAELVAIPEAEPRIGLYASGSRCPRFAARPALRAGAPLGLVAGRQGAFHLA